jgi:hypothetical protein
VRGTVLGAHSWLSPMCIDFLHFGGWRFTLGMQYADAGKRGIHLLSAEPPVWLTGGSLLGSRDLGPTAVSPGRPAEGDVETLPFCGGTEVLSAAVGIESVSSPYLSDSCGNADRPRVQRARACGLSGGRDLGGVSAAAHQCVFYGGGLVCTAGGCSGRMEAHRRSVGADS